MRVPEISRDDLYDAYIVQNKNRYQISKETGVDPTRIGTLLQKYGIHRKPVERHGLSKHPLNAVWCGMKERCTNPNATNYLWYGGKGITVCDEWMSFLPFYQWATQNGWHEGLTVDRIDCDKGYSPANCRLVPLKDQFRNRSSNVYITVDGVTKLQCEWTELLGLKSSQIAKWKKRHDLDYVVCRLRKMMKELKMNQQGEVKCQ